MTGKRHDHVMRDIRSMLDELDPEVQPTFGGYYKASNGKQNPCFNPPRRETDILLTDYSTTMRAAVIDHWLVRLSCCYSRSQLYSLYRASA